MSTPDFLPILSAGSHRSPTEGACFMEYASFLAGERFSDSPACSHPVLATLARTVNDRLPDDQRHRIAHLIPAVIGTADLRDDEHERQVLSVRLAAWCAEQVLDLVPSRSRQVCADAIAAARGWCDGTVTPEQRRAAAIAAAAASASYAPAAYAPAAYAAAAYAPAAYAAAAYAIAAAASAAASASYAAAAAYASDAAAADRLVALLEGAFAEHARITGRDIPTADPGTYARLAQLTA